MATKAAIQAERDRLREELAQAQAALKLYQRRTVLLARLIQITRDGLQKRIDHYSPYDATGEEEATFLTRGMHLAVERLDRAHAYCDPATQMEQDRSKVEWMQKLWDGKTGDPAIEDEAAMRRVAWFSALVDELEGGMEPASTDSAAGLAESGVEEETKPQEA